MASLYKALVNRQYAKADALRQEGAGLDTSAVSNFDQALLFIDMIEHKAPVVLQSKIAQEMDRTTLREVIASTHLASVDGYSGYQTPKITFTLIELAEYVFHLVGPEAGIFIVCHLCMTEFVRRIHHLLSDDQKIKLVNRLSELQTALRIKNQKACLDMYYAMEWIVVQNLLLFKYK